MTAFRDFNLILMSASLVGIVTAYLVFKAWLRLYLSPLSRSNIPGPTIAAASDVWFDYQALRRNRVWAIRRLFEIHGPVVRIGPNRVAVADPTAVREVYRTHAFRKGDAYFSLTFGGTQNSWNTSDPALHDSLRRLTFPTFRGDNLRAAARALEGEMDVLISRIQRDSLDGAAVDVLRLFRLVSLDALGIMILGTPFNQIASGQSHDFTRYTDDWLLDKGLKSVLPPLVYNFLKALPVKRLRKVFKADHNLCAVVADLYNAADDQRDPEKPVNILTTCKSYRDHETKAPVAKDVAVGEVAVFLAAGTDTTGHALAYMTYELAKRPEIWQALRTELSTVPNEARFDIDLLRTLPYLNACIKEVLRIHGSGNVYIERVVPEGGAVLAGYFLPGGTKVGGLALSSHLDESIFPNPHEMIPERWLQWDGESSMWSARTGEMASEMLAAWYPFSQGARACAGRPVAEMELLLVASTLVRNFRFDLHESTTEDSMRGVDTGVLGPNAGRCLIRFNLEPITLI